MMTEEDERLTILFQEYFDQVMETFPHYATFLGYKHEKFDHLLPDGTLKAQYRDISRFLENKTKLEGIDYEGLSDHGKLDYNLIRYFLELEFFQMTELASWAAGALLWGTNFPTYWLNL